jgi:hypothetical protein
VGINTIKVEIMDTNIAAYLTEIEGVKLTPLLSWQYTGISAVKSFW